MKRGLYTIYDKVMEEAGPLFYANNHAHAMRNFMAMIQDTKIDKVMDYNLVYIASVDTQTMIIEPAVPFVISDEEGNVK